MYDGLLLLEYWQNGQKESFQMGLLPASTLVSIGRRQRLSLMWSSCRRQTAVTTSCECATIKFGCPNALAFSRRLLICSQVAVVIETLVSLQRAPLGRSGTGHTRSSSLVWRPCGSSCSQEMGLAGQEILLLCRDLYDHKSFCHAHPIVRGPH